MVKVEDVAQFCNGQKSETACQHEDACGDVHDRVVLEAYKRIGEQRKAHTAERADRLENGA